MRASERPSSALCRNRPHARRGLSARVLLTLLTWAAAVTYAVIPYRPLFNSARTANACSELDQAIWAREARS